MGSMCDAYGYLFRRARSVFGVSYDAYFKARGIQITAVLGGILIMIDENPGISQIELARLNRIEGSSLWQSVTRLVELGYIDRVRSECDQRVFELRLSAHGQDIVREVRRGMRQHQRALLSVLSPIEREALKAMLIRLIKRGEGLMMADKRGVNGNAEGPKSESKIRLAPAERQTTTKASGMTSSNLKRRSSNAKRRS